MELYLHFPICFHGEYRHIFTLLWYMNTGHTISFRLHPYAFHILCCALSQCSWAAGFELCIGGLMTVPYDRMISKYRIGKDVNGRGCNTIWGYDIWRSDTVNVFLNIVFSWYTTPCNLLDRYQRFVGKYCPLLEDNSWFLRWTYNLPSQSCCVCTKLHGVTR